MPSAPFSTSFLNLSQTNSYNLPTNPPTPLPTMCFRRHVCYIYAKCGHAFTMPEEVIQCNSATCIFSPNHPPTCTGASCKRTCWQYRQPSEQYSPQINEFCPSCLQHR